MVETKITKHEGYMVMEQVKIHDEICEWAKAAKELDDMSVTVTCRHVVMDLDDSLSGDEVDQKLHECLNAEPFNGEEAKVRLAVMKNISGLFNIYVLYWQSFESSDRDVPDGFSVSAYPEDFSEAMWFVLYTILDGQRTFR